MTAPHRNAGFSLVELLIAMTITITALGIAMTALNDVSDTREAATLLTDSNQSLRTSVNLIERDLLSVGRLIPVGGVPVPNGAGAAPINRPGPTGGGLTFTAGDTTLPALSPGNGIGPVVNGAQTDVMNMLMVDSTPLCGTAFSLESMPLVNIAADGSTATVNAAVPVNCAGDAITAGDLILFSNGLGNAIQMVTETNGQVLTFGGGDVMNLNQRGAAQGSILELQTGPGVFPPTTASRVLMISYYVDTAVANRPRLMRRVNMRNDRAIGIGIEGFQLTYDLADGVTNPVNQPAPVAPNTAHQIRKANMVLSGRSHAQWSRSRQFLRTTLASQVSLRNLAFVDRYQ